MEKYDCKNCIHSKKRTVANRGKCEHCTVDSKNLQGKPSQYREKDKWNYWFKAVPYRLYGGEKR